jgi:hypothetical protein
MKSFEVLRRVFKQVGCKNIPGELKLSLSLIHQWARGTVRNPLEVVARMSDFPGGQALLDWLCQRKGGFFVRNPSLKVWRAMTLLKATAVVVGHFCKFQSHLAQADERGRIEPAAAEQLRADWEELKSEVESFVVACERGAFRYLVLFALVLPWLALEPELAAG